ncbi:MAG: DNA-binding protein [Candidatus Nanopelagicaceae bacterium]|nr:DNA-binding protein [Candidatus Nanopelagicaceae bacterium]
MAAPARRALVNNKILKLADLKRFTIDQVADFHGMGPNALSVLKKAKAPFKK